MLSIAPVKTFSVDAAIAMFLQRAEDLALAKKREMVLEYERPLLKSEAIARIMGKDDPQKDGKKYSAATELVATDEVYAMHLEDQRNATADTIRAEGAYKAAGFICRYLTAGAEVAAE